MRLRHSLNLVYYVLRKIVEFIESNIFIRFFSMIFITKLYVILILLLFIDVIEKIGEPIIQVLLSLFLSIPFLILASLYVRSIKMIADKIFFKTEIPILDEVFDNTLGLLLKEREENDK